MSDASSLSASLPTHAELEQALKNVVHDIYKSGDLENLTVKRVRKAAEENLDLEEGFFKNDKTWKDKSKDVILSEVVRAVQKGSSIIAVNADRNIRKLIPILHHPKPRHQKSNYRQSRKVESLDQPPMARNAHHMENRLQ